MRSPGLVAATAAPVIDGERERRSSPARAAFDDVLPAVLRRAAEA